MRKQQTMGTKTVQKKATMGTIDDGNTMRKQKTMGITDYRQFKKIKNIESRYTFGRTIGQGAFGIVRICLHISSGTKFAIKIMKKR